MLDVLKGYKNLVWVEVKKYLKDPGYHELFKVDDRFKHDTERVWQAVKDYPERQGKYLRPSLLMMVCQAMGGEPKKALKVAAAVQISEDWLLIHDDIEDDSVKRRGKTCLHRKFGLGQALNAGDMLHIIMWRVLLDNGDIRVMKEFNKVLTRTALGQGVEMNWVASGKLRVSEADWLFIADGKTAYYSIVAPLRLGGMIAGASNEQLDKLTEFGLYLGRCFQLVDDLLDIVEGEDIKESKRTLILGHLLDRIKGKDKFKLVKILGKAREKKTEAEVVWVMKKMEELGSIAYAKTRAKEYKKQALEYFKENLGFLEKEPARSSLVKLVSFVLERDH